MSALTPSRRIATVVAVLAVFTYSYPNDVSADSQMALEMLYKIRANQCADRVFGKGGGGSGGLHAFSESFLGQGAASQKDKPCSIPWGMLTKDDDGRCGSYCRSYRRWLRKWPLQERYADVNYDLDTPGRGLTDVPNKATDSIVDWLFGFYRDVVRFSLNITNEAFTLDLVSKLSMKLSKGYESLHRSIFWRFEGFLILLGGIYLFYGLLTRRVARTVGYALLQIVLIGLATYMAVYPTKLISEANKISKSTSMAMLDVIGRASSGKNSQRYSKDPAEHALAVSGERIWRSFVYEPWASAEFGFATVGNTQGNDRANNNVRRAVKRDAFKVLITDPILRQWPDDGVLGSGIGSKDADELGVNLKDLKIGNPAQPYPGFDKSASGKRMRIVLLTGVAGGVFSFILLIIAAQLFIAQLLFILLIALAPFFLLLALVPGRGFAYLRNYVGALLITLLAKIVYAVFIGIFIYVAGIVVGSSYALGGADGIYISMALVALMAYAAWKQRHTLLALGKTNKAVVTGLAKNRLPTRKAAYTSKNIVRRVAQRASRSSRTAGGKIRRQHQYNKMQQKNAEQRVRQREAVDDKHKKALGHKDRAHKAATNPRDARAAGHEHPVAVEDKKRKRPGDVPSSMPSVRSRRPQATTEASKPKAKASTSPPPQPAPTGRTKGQKVPNAPYTQGPQKVGGPAGPERRKPQPPQRSDVSPNVQAATSRPKRPERRHTRPPTPPPQHRATDAPTRPSPTKKEAGDHGSRSTNKMPPQRTSAPSPTRPKPAARPINKQPTKGVSSKKPKPPTKRRLKN